MSAQINNCSIAIQVLPMKVADYIPDIDRVIYYLQERFPDARVTPFETVIEGEYEECMDALRQCALIAAEEGSDDIIVNAKIAYGQILTSEEKTAKFQK
ncbi:thiamine-binding protein [Alloscardovia macacae]|uniref:thiamine-binding protein n=1 Tax=Alloscardovia macacae TaxID=1160091 RepID=UPI00214D87E8|nr:thiamine-binding protein [Alloscardovia macacae]